MKLFRHLFAATIGLVLIQGCGDDSPTAPTDDLNPPTNLTFENGDGQIELKWGASPEEGLSTFSGYQVYRSTSSLSDVKSADLDDFRINASPLGRGVHSLADAGLANGVKYYYEVRSLATSGKLSGPTTEIDTAARAEGGVVPLAEFADATRNSGFDLSTGSAVSVSSDSPDNRMLVDVYVGTTDSQDAAGSPLTIKSPNLVLGGSPNWSTRVAGVKLLDSWETSSTSASGWLDNIVLGSTEEEIEGKVFAIRTPPLENGNVHYGKCQIISVSGADGQRQIRILWAYQSLPNYIRF